MRMMPGDFNPDGVGLANMGVFGLPYSVEEADVVLIPAPWGVTVSYGGGTHEGPRAIFDASPQIDYWHKSFGGDSWKTKVAMLSLDDFQDSYLTGIELREKATHYIEQLTEGNSGDANALKTMNDECEAFHARIEETATQQLKAGKLVGLIGGDHSTPLGLMKALAKEKGNFGILQIDAHCDLRDAYEGFTYSHASIMFNALKIPQVKKLVQVGIRDFSPGEKEMIDNSNGRIATFFDAENRAREYEGETWAGIVDDVIGELPENVYISFDIDGLEPGLCPHTGTPVPGGLKFQEAMYLIEAVAQSGKKIIGFDVNEVSPGEGNTPYFAEASKGNWDANVGMRVLWNLVQWSAKS